MQRTCLIWKVHLNAADMLYMEGSFGCCKNIQFALYGSLLLVGLHSPLLVCMYVAAVMQVTGGDGVGCLFEATGVPPVVNGCFELLR